MSWTVSRVKSALIYIVFCGSQLECPKTDSRAKPWLIAVAQPPHQVPLRPASLDAHLPHEEPHLGNPFGDRTRVNGKPPPPIEQELAGVLGKNHFLPFV